ncbi:hypothetical protein EMCG_04869 [[Emmonsia] crescens]|uniref:Uncharacterized protein n=1 Tax=[Emmonsia] crescens TaxID=73230 RepID=A0A0G2J6W2_9EURO|nr:hypothetical protein EMCG_04869 [Emmonsia crescens UAMH 3008]
MPRPPARRGRRPKGAKIPETAAARDSRQPYENNFAVVVLPKSNQAQGPEAYSGYTEKISHEGHRENSHGAAHIQRGEPVANEEGDLEVAKHQAQTPASKHQNGASKLSAPIDAMSSATGKAFLSNLPNRGDSSSRVQKIGTPAFESSMLSNFRRRPRQPSILQMMQGDPSSELDADDDDLLGGFDPDDESTPLKFSSRKSLPQHSVSTPSSTPRNLLSASLKKRKLHTEAQVQVSRSCDPYELAIATDESADNSASEDDLLPTPKGAQSTEPPEVLSQTMMPPESSPVSSVEKRGLDAAHYERSENAKSPPRTRKASGKQPPTVCKPRVSTATLRENLLPQRRLRNIYLGANHGNKLTSDDIESEHLPRGYSGTFEDDQDELNYSASRVSKRRKNTAEAGARKGTRNKKRADTAKDIQDRRQKPAIKSANIQPSTISQVAHSKKGDEITYSSRERHAEIADKENLIHTASSPPLESEVPISPPASERVFLSEELMQQARKFAEISQWPLAFEDSTVTSCQSSPFR